MKEKIILLILAGGIFSLAYSFPLTIFAILTTVVTIEYLIKLLDDGRE